MSTQQEPQSFTLSMEREFDAPRDLVFTAFMDPQTLSRLVRPGRRGHAAGPHRGGAPRRRSVADGDGL